ncbi:recombinase RecU [Bacillus pseudomycoides]|uniref:Recombinase RecU n=1 Tax=Bacillus pseudomycoides TaxID=64104 RepID=A0AAJ1Z761_9BACI|nr:recombinase RecU [Bacillus pseudomycoides]MDR4328672.1 recombinase RecU [Bacillus pseudomycoides]PEF22398.1 recombinase RecU [Bacillus pseudomycoides]PEJ39674.1 recombinase RecU [Bacillus pseudomycoides]PEK36370.1 recombinase RecU [Bacillus pseudomycoides]
MDLGNRGMHFEMLINLSNEMHQRDRLARINKPSDSCEGVKK